MTRERRIEKETAINELEMLKEDAMCDITRDGGACPLDKLV